jgi:hypothetical protein
MHTIMQMTVCVSPPIWIGCGVRTIGRASHPSGWVGASINSGVGCRNVSDGECTQEGVGVVNTGDAFSLNWIGWGKWNMKWTCNPHPSG